MGGFRIALSIRVIQTFRRPAGRPHPIAPLFDAPTRSRDPRFRRQYLRNRADQLTGLEWLLQDFNRAQMTGDGQHGFGGGIPADS